MMASAEGAKVKERKRHRKMEKKKEKKREKIMQYEMKKNYWERDKDEGRFN